MNPYIFDNAAEAQTAERFAALDALYNVRTFRFLETAGIAPGWHCLEVGGGSSAVAAWMADRVGPSGSVLVTDIDPRFMERSVYRRPPHLELRRHDIGTDPLPERAFDLIHARLVLMHVPQREGLVTDAEIDAVLARLDTPDFAIFSLVMFTAWGRRLP